ncbi:isocitrate/isopropylmalate family dehydrogenase [Alphaproteobacteria bacterium]|nr:isocitrate/isopropylmalate family dehydrogenase [Alphaproteobacteria bacterium]
MKATISLIKGDGIGIDVSEAAMFIAKKAIAKAGIFAPKIIEIAAGASYFVETGNDIQPGGEVTAGAADAIFLGAIGLPEIRHENGTEISPHLRLRDRYQLYAGVRPVKAYPNAPMPLADPRANKIDLVIIRESTEGLFFSAAVHGRSKIIDNAVCDETLRITRATSEKLHDFAFRLATKRKDKGHKGQVTCVDKANVFASMAFFRQIFDEVSANYPDINKDYNYVDAAALDLIRRPWTADVMVMENMFGDILSDLAGGLVGGMGMAACGEIGDQIGLFQPAHGSAPDIMGQDKANPLAAILSAKLMLDYLAEKLGQPAYEDAAMILDTAIETGFALNRFRPIEFGGNMGTKAVTLALSSLIDGKLK